MLNPITFTVQAESGPLEVTANGLDYAAYEDTFDKAALPAIAEGRYKTWTFLVWHAMKRQGLTGQTFEEFLAASAELPQELRGELEGRGGEDASVLGLQGAGDFHAGGQGDLRIHDGGFLRCGVGGGGTTGGGTTITGGTTGGGSSGGGTIGGAVTKIAKDTKKVVDDVAGAFDNFTSGTTTLAGVMAASNQPFAFGTSGVNTNTLAGILAASNKPNVTVNFNGVTTDPEGTARVLVDTINNSFYRGTNGATNLVTA
jgi:hypothetical protein